MFTWLKRLRLMRNIDFQGKNSEVIFSPSVKLQFSANSKIVVKPGARFRVGYPLPSSPAYPSRSSTLISLEENATLVVEGDVVIGPGSCLRVCRDATVIFGGDNMIAHDFFLMVRDACNIGKKTSISWNVTLIDNDGHEKDILRADGKPFRRRFDPIHIGTGVGIQMNVVMPSGRRIGDQAVVAANVVIREDVPEKCLIYQKSETVVKEGVHCAHF